MKGTKVIFLALAFLLPVLVFLFLKYFGRNEFNVEPLFQTPDAAIAERCPSVVFPYRVADRSSLGASSADNLLLIYTEEDASIKKELARVRESYNSSEVHLVSLQEVVPDSLVASTRDCILLLREPFNTVLLDKAGLLYGQYDLRDLDEADRLLVELKIILKQY